VLVGEGRVHEVSGRAVSDAFWRSSAACNCFLKYTNLVFSNFEKIAFVFNTISYKKVGSSNFNKWKT
jgi:hypothetical protein